MISFTCDYNEGAHPLVLHRLADTNFTQEPGYGEDSFSESARAKIRAAAGLPEAEVFFLVGGTQANATVKRHGGRWNSRNSLFEKAFLSSLIRPPTSSSPS